MLIFSSLVPTKIRKRGKEILTIEPISIHSARNRLSEISKTHSLEDLPQLKYLMESYGFNEVGSKSKNATKQPTVKRMMLLSLSGLNPKLQNTILKSDSFNKTMERSDLATLMLSSSGSTRQDYLNSCNATMYTQSILAKVTSPVVLQSIALDLHKNLVTLLNGLTDENSKVDMSQKAWKGGPTIKEAAEYRLKKSEAEINKFAARLNALLEKATITPKELKKIKQDWNKIMERLLSVADLEKEGEEKSIPANTGKILKNWHLSLVLNVLLYFLSFAFIIGNKPSLGERSSLGAFSNKGIKLALSKSLEINTTEKVQLGKELVDEKSKTEKLKIIREKWENIAKKGGAVIKRPKSHSLYLKAFLNQNGEKVFAIADPMHSDYKIKSEEEMIKYAINNNLDLVA